MSLSRQSTESETPELKDEKKRQPSDSQFTIPSGLQTTPKINSLVIDVASRIRFKSQGIPFLLACLEKIITNALKRNKKAEVGLFKPLQIFRLKSSINELHRLNIDVVLIKLQELVPEREEAAVISQRMIEDITEILGLIARSVDIESPYLKLPEATYPTAETYATFFVCYYKVWNKLNHMGFGQYKLNSCLYLLQQLNIPLSLDNIVRLQIFSDFSFGDPNLESLAVTGMLKPLSKLLIKLNNLGIINKSSNQEIFDFWIAHGHFVSDFYSLLSEMLKQGISIDSNIYYMLLENIGHANSAFNAIIKIKQHRLSLFNKKNITTLLNVFLTHKPLIPKLAHYIVAHPKLTDHEIFSACISVATRRFPEEKSKSLGLEQPAVAILNRCCANLLGLTVSSSDGGKTSLEGIVRTTANIVKGKLEQLHLATEDNLSFVFHHLEQEIIYFIYMMSLSSREAQQYYADGIAKIIKEWVKFPFSSILLIIEELNDVQRVKYIQRILETTAGCLSFGNARGFGFEHNVKFLIKYGSWPIDLTAAQIFSHIPTPKNTEHFLKYLSLPRDERSDIHYLFRELQELDFSDSAPSGDMLKFWLDHGNKASRMSCVLSICSTRIRLTFKHYNLLIQDIENANSILNAFYKLVHLFLGRIDRAEMAEKFFNSKFIFAAARAIIAAPELSVGEYNRIIDAANSPKAILMGMHPRTGRKCFLPTLAKQSPLWEPNVFHVVWRLSIFHKPSKKRKREHLSSSLMNQGRPSLTPSK